MRLIATLIVAVFGLTAVARAGTITVAAAVSMKDALAQIAIGYKAAGGDEVEFVFGSSGQLAEQVRNGAPVDVFISAAAKQMNDLAAAGLVKPRSTRVIAGNRLVLIAPAGSTLQVASLAALGEASIARLAIGEPRIVPAGQYAIEALRAAGVESVLADRIVTGTNVRQVLNYVQRGEVTVGLVYATDARLAGDRVRTIFAVSQNLHSPIVYSAGVVTSTQKRAAAQKFLDYLGGTAAQTTLADFGFTAPPVPSTQPTR